MISVIFMASRGFRVAPATRDPTPDAPTVPAAPPSSPRLRGADPRAKTRPPVEVGHPLGTPRYRGRRPLGAPARRRSADARGLTGPRPVRRAPTPNPEEPLNLTNIRLSEETTAGDPLSPLKAPVTGSRGSGAGRFLPAPPCSADAFCRCPRYCTVNVVDACPVAPFSVACETAW